MLVHERSTECGRVNHAAHRLRLATQLRAVRSVCHRPQRLFSGAGDGGVDRNANLRCDRLHRLFINDVGRRQQHMIATVRTAVARE